MKITKRITPELYDAFHDMKNRKVAVLSCALAKVEHQDAPVVLANRK